MVHVPFDPISLTHSFSHQSLKPVASENLNKLWISILENHQLIQLSGSDKGTRLHGTKKVEAMYFFFTRLLSHSIFFQFQS